MCAKHEIIRFVHSFSDRVQNYINELYRADLSVDVLTSFDETLMFSLGGITEDSHGTPFVLLSVHEFIDVYPERDLNYLEIKQAQRRPDIGNMANVSWAKCLAALIAHEFAHVVQFNPKTAETAFRMFGVVKTTKNWDSHGKLWRAIYSDLRMNLVNSEAM